METLNAVAHLRAVLAGGAIAATLACPGAATAQTQTPRSQAPCSPVITNGSCTITIDRDSPVSPLPMRMKRGATATLRFTKRPLDSIQLDVSTSDVAPPDPVAAIIGAFLPSLAKIESRVSVFGGANDTRSLKWSDEEFQKAVKVPTNPYAALIERAGLVDAEQITAEKKLATSLQTAKAAGTQLKAFQSRSVDDWVTTPPPDRTAAQVKLVDVLRGAAAVGPPGDIAVARALLDEVMNTAARLPAPSPDDRPKYVELMSKLADLTANQAQLEAGARIVSDKLASLGDAAGIIEQLDMTTALEFTKEFKSSATQTGRTVSIKATAQDVVSKTATPLGGATVTWNDSRWEVSAGAIFSELPKRKFENVALVENGLALRDDKNSVRTQVRETVTEPMVVPFALAHFRLGERSVGGRRLAALVTAGIGVNTSSGTADFSYGASVSYRLLILSLLRHHAQDLILTDGVKPGSELGPSAPAPPTERLWVDRWALGVSLRIPF